MNILVAEDSPVNQKLVVRQLESRGHSVEAVETGDAAVERFRNGDFDVVLMDLELPGMDGYEATRLIREAERDSGTHTPIIAMTAHASKDVKKKCLEAGMDDYLSKPAHSDELWEKVESARPDRETVR